MGLEGKNKEEFLKYFNDYFLKNIGSAPLKNRTEVFNYLEKKINSGSEDQKSHAAKLKQYIEDRLMAIRQAGDPIEPKPELLIQYLDQKANDKNDPLINGKYLNELFEDNGFADYHSDGAVELRKLFDNINNVLTYYLAAYRKQQLEDALKDASDAIDKKEQAENDADEFIKACESKNENALEIAKGNLNQPVEYFSEKEQLEKDIKSAGLETEENRLNYIDNINKEKEQLKKDKATLERVEKQLSDKEQELAALKAKPLRSPEEILGNITDYQPRNKDIEDDITKNNIQIDAFRRTLDDPQYAERVSRDKAYRSLNIELETKEQEFIKSGALDKYHEAHTRFETIQKIFSREIKTVPADIVNRNKTLNEQMVDCQGIMNDVIQDYPKQISTYYEAYSYVNTPANSSFRTEYLTVESGIANLTVKNKELSRKIEDNEKLGFDDRKALAEKEGLKLSDDELKGLSNTELADKIIARDEASKNKEIADIQERLKQGRNLPKYKALKENVEQQSKKLDGLDPEKIVEDIRKREKALDEKWKKAETKFKLNNSKETISTNMSTASNAVKSAAIKINGLKVNQAEKIIKDRLEEFDRRIETLSRNKTRWKGAAKAEQDAFKKNNSKDFLDLREHLMTTLDIFNNPEATYDAKQQHLEQLQEKAGSYVRTREAQWHPFNSATRNFRMSFVRSIRDFCEENIKILGERSANWEADLQTADETLNKDRYMHETHGYLSSYISEKIKDAPKVQRNEEIENALKEQMEGIIPSNMRTIAWNGKNIIAVDPSNKLQQKDIEPEDIQKYTALNFMLKNYTKLPKDRCEHYLTEDGLNKLAAQVGESTLFNDVADIGLGSEKRIDLAEFTDNVNKDLINRAKTNNSSNTTVKENEGAEIESTIDSSGMNFSQVFAK